MPKVVAISSPEAQPVERQEMCDIAAGPCHRVVKRHDRGEIAVTPRAPEAGFEAIYKVIHFPSSRKVVLNISILLTAYNRYPVSRH